ncbi:MAG: SLC13/DASS family transporter [Epsilonproteobacteria bacterium]|nr:SLC13/DASS family transporter [Campylobacterota bacterium]
MKQYIYPLIIAAIVFALAHMYFNTTSSSLLSIVVLMIAFWMNEALPLGVVSLFPIILFPLFHILDLKEVSTNYSHHIIFLFIGGFLMAIAVEKTNLHRVLASKLISIFPPNKLIFAMSFTSALLSAFLSNTTTTLLLLPIALYLSTDEKFTIRLVLAIAYGASIGGIITPIGTPPNLILMGFLDDNNLPTLTFAQWMLKTIPLAAIMLIIVSFVLSWGIKEIKIEKLASFTLNSQQKKLSIILGLMIVMLFANAFLKIPDAIILLSFGLLLFMPKLQFLVWEDTKKIPYEIVFLFGAGFSIAKAFVATHLADKISQILLSFTHSSELLLLFITATVVTFATEITSNTALISIALPIIYAMGIDNNMLMLATICASYAFMLPIATPPNAIAFSSGIIKIQTMAKYGLLFNILAIITTTLFAYLVWK